ncbi:glycosyltransferase [Streptomyces brevispora]|uniref:Glycosyltransferase n=1 Tax=Streptomyces brevispora TaxID=887462 RepID=A0A561UV79_9ACTN|nr:glycosyltransferase [Streptomyces brevispora]TWG03257.1 glycosyltransferase involved in cell wall biosynthesis [Streptomyces brevispora]WSC15681.1 glycosyltransferase [Streptomyces brevispora]
MKNCQVSIVVPCYNEDEAVKAFHCALVAVLEPTGKSFEVCYVDDGSEDLTRAQLIHLAAVDERVRYTAFSRNFGKEAAMLAGLRMARGESVVLMDADLQHPPELLPRMLELSRHGYDQVIARRDREGEGALRSFVSRSYYRAMGHFMDVSVVDGEGDFRLLSRRAVDSVLALPESNRFSKGIFSWIGFDTTSFTYHNAQRVAGRSKWGGRRLLNYGIDGLISFNNRPLRLAIYAGLLMALAAMGYAVWIIVEVARNGVGVPGYTTLLTAVVALGGIQLATLGIVGEYVGRIYGETKNRPHYLIRESSEQPAPAAPDRPLRVRGGGSSAYGSGRGRTVRQFLTFAMIGVVNTAVYLGVYATLNRWIPYLTAHVIGYCVSIIGSFLLNSYITCRTSPTWRAFVRFPLSSLVNLVLSGVLLYVGVSHLGMGKNIAALIAGILATPFSFLLARWAITSGAAVSRQPEPLAGARAGRSGD